MPKEKGGLGIKDISIHNQALYFEWPWRFHDEPNSVWKSVTCSKYKFRTENGIPLTTSPSLSNVIKTSTWNSCPMISEVGFCVGNGELISFWTDQWLSTDVFCGAYGETTKNLLWKMGVLFATIWTLWLLIFKQVQPSFNLQLDISSLVTVDASCPSIR
ncbi:conserved hypothetical protein [Ricinus communis]|uniref:Reverse transcriptase zinc-binding domain-containing protein n=1 Tax=Ricinus communis TaxID=3988 RepID=B9SY50_RICCO|nr:conserved hypothetical protein [Ricinus communis]